MVWTMIDQRSAKRVNFVRTTLKNQEVVRKMLACASMAAWSEAIRGPRSTLVQPLFAPRHYFGLVVLMAI